MKAIALERSESTNKRSTRPPVSLTFLAPAERCNQRCPSCYLTEVADEPVRSFDLSPEDFGRFLEQFLDAGIPVVATQFQGYEVTLPRSWPYVEAVFRTAQRHRIRRGFVTNGMLLHQRADRIRGLDLHRISVSLDGSTPAFNDRVRGLAGAFEATCSSVKRFLERAPEYRDRVAIASLLRDDVSFRSLLGMPRVMRRLGLRTWLVSVELEYRDETIQPSQPEAQLVEHLEALRAEAAACDIDFHGSPEYEPKSATRELTEELYQRFFYRLDPTGHVLVGRGVFQRWSADQLVRWRPNHDRAPEAVGYQAATSDLLRRLGHGHVASDPNMR